MLRLAVGLSALITLLASLVGFQPQTELNEPSTIQHFVIGSLPPAAPDLTSQTAAGSSLAAAAAPTPMPTAVPAPSADQAWSDLQPSLDAAWGRDTAEAVALLDGFLKSFPDYQPARTKLYAALLAAADQARQAGQPEQAVQALERARELLPDRPEAGAALASLTPTPLPTPTERPAVVPTPTERPSVVPPPAQPPQAVPTRRPATTAPRPTPTPRPATSRPATVPQQPPPTPTKVPFTVPVR